MATSYTPETGTAEETVCVESSVSAELGTNSFEVNVNENNFVDEIYTLNYIGNIFSNLQNIFTSCQTLISSAKSYVQNADIADQIPMFDILDFNFTFSGTEEFEQAKNDNQDISLNIQAVVSTDGGSLNLRSGAGTNNDVIAKLSNKTKLTVINNDTSSEWIEVKTEDGTTGFVSREYLSIQEPSSSTSNTTTKATDETNISKVTLSSGHLNVRSSESFDADNKIGTLENGTDVEVIERMGNFTKIKYGNGVAYVATKYLSGGSQ